MSIEARHTDAHRRVVVGCFVVLFAAVVWPLFATRMLPLYDYANHLARMYIIANLDRSATLQQFYEVHWSAIPNLAMDLIVPPLSTMLGVETAGKLFIALTFLLIASGVSVLHYVMYGRLSPYPLIAFLFLYSGTFLYGFLNYLFAVGVYLLVFSLWVATGELSPLRRFCLFSALTTSLFFLHLYGLGLYGLMVLGFEASRAFASRHEWRRLRVTWLVAAGQFIVPALIFALASPTSDAVGRTTLGDLLNPMFYLSKPLYLWDLLDNYVTSLDLITAGALVAFFGWGLLSGRLRLARHTVLPLFLLTAAFLFMPETLVSSWAADRRLAVPLVLTFIAVSEWRLDSGRLRMLFCAAVVALCVARTVAVTSAWSQSNELFQGMREAFTQLPEGARLTGALGYRGSNRDMIRAALNHFGNYIVIDKNGLYSTIFADPAQQVISLKYPRHYEWVSFLNEELSLDFMKKWRDPYSSDFVRFYDFTLVRGYEQFPEPLPSSWKIVVRGRGFLILKIKHGDSD